MNLQHLVYVSTASAPIDAAMIADILATSNRNNPANNITGALAFTDDRFVQLVEGSHGSLDVLILKLMLDPRHNDLIFVDRAPIAARSFADWSMAAPAPTDLTRRRIDALLADETRSIDDYRRLLLDLIAAP